MTTVEVLGSTNFEALPEELKGPVSEGMRAAVRIHLAKEAAERLAQALKAADDLPFWARRILRALKRQRTSTTNKWSVHGSLHPHYATALEGLLGEPFKVTTIPPFGNHAGYVYIEW